MRIRETARVVLLNEDRRVLLLRIQGGELKELGGAIREAFWITPGGRIESGESVQQAARREILEETGLRDIEIGPMVWYGEQILLWQGIPALLKESFVLAHASRIDLDDAGMSVEERFAIRELRWWNLTELLGTEQRVLPRNLANLVVDLLKNGPGAVRKIDLSAHDGW